MGDEEISMEREAELTGRVDTAISGLARATVAGIAACLAAAFKEGVDVAFPLGCFLIAALGYGLYKAGDILGDVDVILFGIRPAGAGGWGD